MALSPYKTWISGEVLTASDLNSSFSHLTNNATSLISPLTAALDMNGLELILDADADTSLTADTDDRLDVKLQGVDAFVFDGTTASIVNGLTFTATATGSGPTIAATGTDTNIQITLKGKGTGAVLLGQSTSTDVRLVADQPIADSSGNELIKFTKTASAVNEVTFKNNATGSNPEISATGGDTDVGIDFTAKGAGRFKFNDRVEWTKGADIASAAPLVLGTDGNYFDVTGTTGFAAITVAAGTLFMLQFDGALTMTHHATNLALPGAADITTAAGDRLIGFAEAADQVRVLSYFRAAVKAHDAIVQGTHTIWVPAVAMFPATTNGATSASIDSGSENVEYKVLDFDTSTQEFAHFAVRFPKSWNEGTVTFAPYWTAASGSGGVVFALQGVSLSDDDAINTAFGTEQTSTDTLITAADVHVGPTSSAITIAGTPAAGDLSFFRIKRNVSDGSDTLGVDARLLGIALFFTVNAQDDT